MKKLLFAVVFLGGCTPPPSPLNTSQTSKREILIHDTSKTCMGFVQECEEWTPVHVKTRFDDVDCNALEDYERRRTCSDIQVAAVGAPAVTPPCESKFNACVRLLALVADYQEKPHVD